VTTRPFEESAQEEMSATERVERTRAADALCLSAYESVDFPDSGVALVAVGGYGRGELAPYSDLDVVLIHADEVDPGEAAATVWYPLWDGSVRLDHAVRSLSDAAKAAESDLRVALGLLDARHLAGDPGLTLRLRTTLLTQWRRDVRARLPDLRALVDQRGRLLGELAHASVPDVKESTGGLRDASVLKALVATWLVDVPHTELERARVALLDVRDHLHATSGRGSDRIAPEVWPDLAEALGLADAEAAQRDVRELGRRIAHISRLTWRRVDALLAAPPSPTGGRRPALVALEPGIALASEEVVLDAGARPAGDPLLLLRAAAQASERDVLLSPATAARLVRESPNLPEPWPAEARRLFVRLLAGPGLLSVWETLDETGALVRLLPEWERVRLLPHASPIHRFTVDRHLVETCLEAGLLVRRVARPDLLLVAALLHDIGKGELTEHSVAGAPIAEAVASRIGFTEEDSALVGRLVRRHLLLPEVATTRDLDDPVTIARVVEAVGSAEHLELLAVLTEADARATSHLAWSSWRARLVTDLVARSARALGSREVVEEGPVSVEIPVALRKGRTHADVAVVEDEDGSRVTVVAADRVGLLADVAAVLALQRVSVRSARAWTQAEWGVSVWEVDATGLDARALRERLQAIAEGRLAPSTRLPAPSKGPEPTVAIRSEASRRASVLEVRASDRPGTVYLVCSALAGLEVTVRSAHLDTLGPQAVDVFYLQEHGAGALSEERAATAAHAVRRALTEPG
jgi:[protein-PII] uridylyltransferase